MIMTDSKDNRQVELFQADRYLRLKVSDILQVGLSRHRRGPWLRQRRAVQIEVRIYA
jgi:hypothetical protein